MRLRTDANIDISRHRTQDVDLAIALTRHARRSAANHCTAVCAMTNCSCPRLVPSKIRCVCELLLIHDLRERDTITPCSGCAHHACPHHYRPSGIPTVPNEYRERNERVVTLVVHCCRGRVVAAARLRSPEAHGILQGCKLFARRLQSGPGMSLLRSRLHQRVAWHAMPRHGASLRAVLAPIFGKAKMGPGKCLSGGATHP